MCPNKPKRMSDLNEFELRKLPRYVQNVIIAIGEGDLEVLKFEIQKAEEKNLTIGWWWDCYAYVYSKAQLECLSYLLDQPCFRFDAPFLNSCCYFTPLKVRNLVCLHPRARHWIEDPALFEREAITAYKSSSAGYQSGTAQRHMYGRDEIWKHHMRLRKLRAAVVLASFFTICSRIFVEEYYAPGGKGYLKGKAEFETLALAA